MKSPPILPADPKANYLAHKVEIDEAIRRVLDHGRYILDAEVNAFEKEFANYLGTQHAIGVANGTDALEVALRACGIGAGDVVITVSHTAVATVAAIERSGATPLLVDIDPHTFTMDPQQTDAAMSARVKAIIPVHLYGHPAPMREILEIAHRHQAFVIEDCAQSHGASIDGRKTGTWGHLAAFSFYPTKNLGALGDGGAIATNDATLAAKVRSLREYGWSQRYISEVQGLNSRLDELQAAILRVKLSYLETENTRRRELARIYDSELNTTALQTPRSEANCVHVYHQYVVRSERRDALRTFLKTDSIETLIHYPVPIHLQPAYRNRINIAAGGLRHTEDICREILSLPLHPHLTDEQVKRVATLCATFAHTSTGTT